MSSTNAQLAVGFGLALTWLVACSSPPDRAHDPAQAQPPSTASLDAAASHDADAPNVGVDAALGRRDAGRADGGALAGRGGRGGSGASGGSGAADAAAAGDSSHGGTITFQEIGAPGFYPSRRDPSSGECTAYQRDSCCMARHEITSDKLTPWNEELIMTLRGPLFAQRITVYQPSASAASWDRVADWDARTAGKARGLAFDGEATRATPFAGTVGDQCLVDVMSDRAFPCGGDSGPYCPAPSDDRFRGYGWEGSKLFVMLLSMPHAGDGTMASAQHCSDDAANNWHDAPWIGFSHGELVRSGKFGDCHCYAKDPAKWWLADGCGQFNAFEVVNDNNEFQNLDVFSTNFFGYQGYIGEGPCGRQCDVSALAPEVDLIDKRASREAASGAVATPERGPGAAFRRPSGARYFVVLFDVDTRAVQLALIAPGSIPDAAATLLPTLPEHVTRATIEALLELRLPR